MDRSEAARIDTGFSNTALSWLSARRLAPVLLAVSLLGMAALKFVDRSWMGEFGQPIGYLTLGGLVFESSIAALLLLRIDRMAGVGLFVFGLGIVL